MNAKEWTGMATVPGIERAPAHSLPYPTLMQWAVDLGVSSAESLLPHLGDVQLFDALNDCARHARQVLEDGSSHLPERPTAAFIAFSVDAYMAGLVGRLQQHLIAGLGLQTRGAAAGTTHH